MTAPSSTITVENVTKTFGRHRALAGISTRLEPGTMTAIIGPNGAGKSTLLGILSTLVSPTEGAVRWGDEPLRPGSELRADIGYVGHEPGLYGELTAAENLVLFARLHGLTAPSEIAARMLERVGLGALRRDARVRTLSRGTQQRVALARALLHHPRLLLLDEPSAALDPAGTTWLCRQLEQESEAGRTVALVTHDLETAGKLARHIVLLSRGRAVLDCRADAPFGAAALRSFYEEHARA